MSKYVADLKAERDAAVQRADELRKHCETHEDIIEALSRDQMANTHWKAEWEQAYSAMLQAQQRAEAAEIDQGRVKAQAEVIAAQAEQIDRLVALIIHDVGDGTVMCHICHRAPDFEVKHTRDCPIPALIEPAATASPEPDR